MLRNRLCEPELGLDETRFTIAAATQVVEMAVERFAPRLYATLGVFLPLIAVNCVILAGSLWLGNRLGFHADPETFYGLYERGAGLGEWTRWLLSDAAPAALLGLFVISTVAAAVGYLVASLTWTSWVRRKRRAAQERLLAQRQPQEPAQS